MSKIYGPFQTADFRMGDRVEIAPHLDLWAMGARVGDVIKVTRDRVHVRLDALPHKAIRLTADNIFAVIQ